MSSESEPKEFLVNQDEDSNCAIELDVDINYRPLKNHFRLYSRFDTSVGECEYEYRIEGTSVLVQLLQDKNRDPGEPEYWDVRDGVVQELAIREREEKRGEARIRALVQSVQEKIEQLKKQTEWTRLLVTAWNGFPYFVLACNLPPSDARRYFRQELERLMQGEKVFIEAAAKLGYEPREAGKYHPKGHRTLQLINGREEPSEEQSKSADLPGVLASVGLTLEEFNCGPNLISQLHELLGDKAQIGVPGERVVEKTNASIGSNIEHPTAKKLMVVFVLVLLVGIVLSSIGLNGSHWLVGIGTLGFLVSAWKASRKTAPDVSKGEETGSKATPLVMKGMSWLTVTVLMAGYYAFALMLMWNWFVAESLHLPELSFVQALGLIWTISLLRGIPDESSPVSTKRWDLLFSVLDYCVPENKIETVREIIKEKTEGVWAELVGLVFGQAVGITLTLGLGWTHTFFM